MDQHVSHSFFSPAMWSTYLRYWAEYSMLLIDCCVRDTSYKVKRKIFPNYYV